MVSQERTVAGCPMELVGRQVNRSDQSIAEVRVHHAHDDVSGDEHGRSSVILYLAGGEPAPFPAAPGGAARVELSEDNVHAMADLHLPGSLERVSQLVPDHLPGWPPDTCPEPIAVIRCEYGGDWIVIGIHYGHEGGGGADHDLTFISLFYWPADHELTMDSAIVVMMLPEEVRGLVSHLRRARDCAGQAAAR